MQCEWIPGFIIDECLCWKSVPFHTRNPVSLRRWISFGMLSTGKGFGLLIKSIELTIQKLDYFFLMSTLFYKSLFFSRSLLVGSKPFIISRRIGRVPLCTLNVQAPVLPLHDSSVTLIDPPICVPSAPCCTSALTWYKQTKLCEPDPIVES